MDRDKEIQALHKQLWWQEKQFNAREVYLLHRIRCLEEWLVENPPKKRLLDK